uniref:Probable membrane transporter protein n=1 Tax=Magnetococcus massalia (strain MO-1) TaxID=451514 RepID=A0A1S7LCN8_MAGMO|nr:conserved membrane protein of unknown function [Candidatus Magnetococcus massalia]
MSWLPAMEISLLWMLLAITFAATIHGAFALGFPMVATPLLALMLDVRQAIVLTLVPTLLVNILTIARAGRGLQSLKRHGAIIVGIVPGVLLGTQLLVVVEPNIFRLALAAMILLHLKGDLLQGGSTEWIGQRPHTTGFLAGLIAGTSVGIVNVMVPILILYLTMAGLTTTTMAVLFNFCFLTGKLLQIALLSHHGLFSWQVVKSSLPLTVAAGVGVLIGMAIRNRLDETTFLRMLTAVLWVMMVMLVVQFFFNL